MPTSATPWLPIASAPRDGTPVLLRWDGGEIHAGRWHSGSGMSWVEWLGSEDWEYFRDDRSPSHWMPIPPLEEE